MRNTRQGARTPKGAEPVRENPESGRLGQRAARRLLEPMHRHAFARALSLLVVLDLLHRFVSLAGGQAPFEYDAYGYWDSARQMAAGDWLLARDAQGFHTPLYPAFLAVCQSLFATRALVAVAILQHLMGVATALLIGWACWRVTKRPQAFLAGYLVSMFTLGAVQYANHALSETLFTFLIAAHVAAWARWQRTPGLAGTATMGATLGLATMVRATTAYLWIPEALVFATCYQLWPRRRLAHALALAAATMVVVLPWLIRNERVLGKAVFSTDLGQCLWYSTFQRGAMLPLPAGEAVDMLAGMDYRREFSVYTSLRRRGMSEVDVDRWMTRISLRAIAADPLAFARKVARSWFGHWYSVEEAYPWYEPTESAEATYFDQVPWRWPQLVNPLSPLLRFAYRYSRVISGLAGISALLGAGALVASRRSLQFGLAILAGLVYFSTVTAVAVVPLYRYRMVTFPLMIASAVAGGFVLLERLLGRAPLAAATTPPVHASH